jgi:hypothetical protein
VFFDARQRPARTAARFKAGLADRPRFADGWVETMMTRKRHWQDWVIYFLGLWLFGSPWFLEHSMVTEIPGGGMRAMWNMWLVGLAIVVLAIVAVEAFKAWEEWANLALGGWLLVSPWVLGFATSTALMWNAVMFGALVLVFAGWSLVSDTESREAAP